MPCAPPASRGRSSMAASLCRRWRPFAPPTLRLLLSSRPLLQPAVLRPARRAISRQSPCLRPRAAPSSSSPSMRWPPSQAPYPYSSWAQGFVSGIGLDPNPTPTPSPTPSQAPTSSARSRATRSEHTRRGARLPRPRRRRCARPAGGARPRRATARARHPRRLRRTQRKEALPPAGRRRSHPRRLRRAKPPPRTAGRRAARAHAAKGARRCPSSARGGCGASRYRYPNPNPNPKPNPKPKPKPKPSPTPTPTPTPSPNPNP